MGLFLGGAGGDDLSERGVRVVVACTLGFYWPGTKERLKKNAITFVSVESSPTPLRCASQLERMVNPIGTHFFCAV